MLKKRVIATVLIRDGIVVQSIGFSRYLPVGSPEVTVENLNRWGIDEIILLDISRSKLGLEPDYDLIRSVSRSCHVPLAVGGGISDLNHIERLLQSGADKVSINQSALKSTELISRASNVYGNQCIIGSVDIKLSPDGGRLVYDYLSRESLNGIKPLTYCSKQVEAGVGELFVNFVDRDGRYNGYDLATLAKLSSRLEVPVIACGGAKSGQDFLDVFEKTQVAAAAAGNMFHFTEHAVIKVKQVLEHREDIRFETVANYDGFQIDDQNRVSKREDAYLNDLLYLKLEKEII